MDVITSKSAIEWIDALAKIFNKKKDFLTNLDREIGDSDHGTNISRGFDVASEQVKHLADKDLGTIFKTVAMSLISKVGGASGALFGSFFLQASTKLNGKYSADTNDLGNMLEAGLSSVLSRGKAEIGDKTMIDALHPAVKVFNENKTKSLTEITNKAYQATRLGADSTKDIMAKKGRASYLGERSIGHIDPGAESIVLFFQTLNQLVRGD